MFRPAVRTSLHGSVLSFTSLFTLASLFPSGQNVARTSVPFQHPPVYCSTTLKTTNRVARHSGSPPLACRRRARSANLSDFVWRGQRDGRCGPSATSNTGARPVGSPLTSEVAERFVAMLDRRLVALLLPHRPELLPLWGLVRDLPGHACDEGRGLEHDAPT
jgi:hypothetical protein